jgi:hypothetical protein
LDQIDEKGQKIKKTKEKKIHQTKPSQGKQQNESKLKKKIHDNKSSHDLTS